ncbi:MAG: formylglycine-generating enzyme family protein [Symploca sp. SIO3E6]|nr:formylglycine-generating enzyme family protein [Caldora sp. SIO3E6]
MARRLAGLLAACPLVSLPIISMIQDAMKLPTQQVHVAEVLLSGLFKLATPIEAQTNPDEIEYKFYEEEIRRILLDSTPVTDTFRVLSQWIDQRLGISIETFMAIIKEPKKYPDLAESVQPFAEVAIEVLKRRGGMYAGLVKPRSLQEFAFKVATIEFGGIGKRGSKEPTVKYYQQKAWQFTEELGGGIELEMVAIPEESFVMGSPETEKAHTAYESPQHQVTVKSFFMSKYPITQAQWKAVAALPLVNHALKPEPSKFPGENRPVERVSWYDAVEFCERLSQKTGMRYRLPSEAEWEYACRAKTTTLFHFGEKITSELANHNRIYGETTPVGRFGVANAFGLYDMHGNVWEWCVDSWHGNYQGAPKDGSVWELDNPRGSRILRGGCWLNEPEKCRSAYRNNFSPDDRQGQSIGFRVVCEN